MLLQCAPLDASICPSSSGSPVTSRELGAKNGTDSHLAFTDRLDAADSFLALRRIEAPKFTRRRADCVRAATPAASRDIVNAVVEATHSSGLPEAAADLFAIWHSTAAGRSRDT